MVMREWTFVFVEFGAMSRIFDQIHQVDQVINFTDKFHVISTQLAPPLNFEMWMIQKQINLEETPGTVR